LSEEIIVVEQYKHKRNIQNQLQTFNLVTLCLIVPDLNPDSHLNFRETDLERADIGTRWNKCNLGTVRTCLTTDETNEGSE
jgi:hypothetical protein